MTRVVVAGWPDLVDRLEAAAQVEVTAVDAGTAPAGIVRAGLAGNPAGTVFVVRSPVDLDPFARVVALAADRRWVFAVGAAGPVPVGVTAVPSAAAAGEVAEMVLAVAGGSPAPEPAPEPAAPSGGALVFCGAKGGAGRTALAVVAARRLAAAGRRTLLVDLSVQRPDLACGLPVGGSGLVGGVAGDVASPDWGRVAVDAGGGLMVLHATGTRMAANPADLPLLRLRALLEAAVAGFDAVVVDTPVGEPASRLHREVIWPVCAAALVVTDLSDRAVVATRRWLEATTAPAGGLVDAAAVTVIANRVARHHDPGRLDVELVAWAAGGVVPESAKFAAAVDAGGDGIGVGEVADPVGVAVDGVVAGLAGGGGAGR